MEARRPLEHALGKQHEEIRLEAPPLDRANTRHPRPDRHALHVVQMQRELGFGFVTDGEVRRATFMSDFNDAIEGMDGNDTLDRTWKGTEAGPHITVPRGIVTGKIRKVRRMTAHEVAFLKPHARNNPYSKRSLHLGMRFSSGEEGLPPGDMALTASNKSAWHAIGDRIAVITVWVNKTVSEAGQVRLASKDWRQEPEVDFNLLSDRRDLVRLTRGFKHILELHDLAPLKAVTSDPFPASFTDKIRNYGAHTTKNAVLTRIGATLMDGPDFVRQSILRGFVMEHAKLLDVLQDNDRLEEYIKRAAVGVWHCSCSNRMGSDDDPMAVTDEQGRVRGVQGLRVVDASIFPQVPCANTNFPTMMVAEKISDEILRETA